MNRASLAAAAVLRAALGEGLRAAAAALAAVLAALLLASCAGRQVAARPPDAAAATVTESVTESVTNAGSSVRLPTEALAVPVRQPAPPPPPPAPAPPSTPDAGFRQRRPEPAATQAPFAAPVPVERKLKSGARLLVVESHAAPLVAVDLLIGTGVDGDPEGKAGLAGFTAQALREGTRKRPSLKLAEELDDLAASLTVRVSLETSHLRLNCLRQTLPQALDLLADVLQSPAFAKEDVDRVRGLLLTGLLQKGSDPAALAADELARRAWGRQHPWGQPAGGTPASLDRILVTDLVKFHETYYRPNNAILSVAGDVTPAEVHKLLEARLAGWKPKALPKPRLPPLPEPAARSIALIDRPGATQSQLQAFLRGSAASGPDLLALRVANAIFGGQSGSRLDQALRGGTGCSDAPRSHLTALRETGLITASGACEARGTAEALAGLAGEFAAFEGGALREGELDRARESLARALPTALESVDEVAGAMAGLAFLGLPLDDYRTLPDRLAKVDAAEVERVAKKYFGAVGLQLVVVGPRAEAEDKLRGLGLGPLEVPGEPPQPPPPPAPAPPRAE